MIAVVVHAPRPSIPPQLTRFPRRLARTFPLRTSSKLLWESETPAWLFVYIHASGSTSEGDDECV